MTLQTGMTVGRAAFLWSDSAYFDAGSGADLIGYGPKVFAGNRWPFAFSFSCIGGNPYRMAEAIEAADPQQLGSLLYHCRDALRDFCSDGHYAQLLVAGWCEQADRARMFLIRCEDHDGDPAFEPIDVLSYLNGGRETLPARVAERKGFTLGRMLRIIDATYQSPPESAREGVVWRIGGDVVQTKVTRDGVFQDIVRSWPVHDEQEAA